MREKSGINPRLHQRRHPERQEGAKDLEAEYKEKTNAVLQASDPDKDAQKAKMIELRKEKHAKFLELLSAEQQAKYNELIEKKKKESGR